MNRLLLISLRGAPGHVHLGALGPRPDYGGSKRNSGATGALIGERPHWRRHYCVIVVRVTVVRHRRPVILADEREGDAARTGTGSRVRTRES